MLFLALGPARLLRHLTAGAAQILARIPVGTSAPILRAVTTADRPTPAATRDDSRPRTGTSALATGSRPLHAPDGPSLGVADAAEVRAWARSRGLHVADRGRISRTITDQYLTAHALQARHDEPSTALAVARRKPAAGRRVLETRTHGLHPFSSA